MQRFPGSFVAIALLAACAPIDSAGIVIDARRSDGAMDAAATDVAVLDGPAILDAPMSPPSDATKADAATVASDAAPPDASTLPDASPPDATDCSVADYTTWCVDACDFPWNEGAPYGGTSVCTVDQRSACEAECVALTAGRCADCALPCITGTAITADGPPGWWNFSDCYCPPTPSCATGPCEYEYWDPPAFGEAGECGFCDPATYDDCDVELSDLASCIAVADSIVATYGTCKGF